jgi:hypothetical protein
MARKINITITSINTILAMLEALGKMDLCDPKDIVKITDKVIDRVTSNMR